MANRSYLYSLSNRPMAYTDLPETISGLSEWPYDVPFIYRLLMSSDPQLCASLVSDGFDDDEPDDKSRLHAISGRFEPGFERVKRFAEIVRYLAEQEASPNVPLVAARAPTAPEAPSLLKRLQGLLLSPEKPAAKAAAPVTVATSAGSTHLLNCLDETISFLEAHRDKFLLLETIELDSMFEFTGDALRACVEQEIARCRHVGMGFEALPADIPQAAQRLQEAASKKLAPPLDAFHGLRFDDECDSTCSGATDHPLGLYWSEVLYFALSNRPEFEEAQRGEAP